jgi:peptidoglycan/xylan/chitin deacetylase (PgdA/CDA1 family)
LTCGDTPVAVPFPAITFVTLLGDADPDSRATFTGPGTLDPMRESHRPTDPRRDEASRRARRRSVRVQRTVAAGLAAATGVAVIVLLTTGGSPRASAPTVPAHTIRHARHAAAISPALSTVQRILRYTTYISRGSLHRNDVALTFDDGPSSYTPEILAILRRAHVRATFFEIGSNITAYPRIAAEVHRDGMLIGDHTETHLALARLSTALQTAQLLGGARAVESVGASFPALFRPPYGSFNAATLAVAHRLRMLMVLWTVDTRDWAQPGVARIEYTALSGARGGTILLFHDGGGNRSQTIAALPFILAKLKERHFHIVTVTRLLRDDPPRHGQPPPRSLSGD